MMRLAPRPSIDSATTTSDWSSIRSETFRTTRCARFHGPAPRDRRHSTSPPLPTAAAPRFSTIARTAADRTSPMTFGSCPTPRHPAVGADLPIPERTGDVINVSGRIRNAIGTSDGFSPWARLSSNCQKPRNGFVAHDARCSLDPLSTVGLFDVDRAALRTGRVFPSSSTCAPSHPRVTRSSRSTRSSCFHIPLTSTGRYALVVTKRALADVDRPLQPSLFMAAALGVPTDGDTDVAAQVRNILVPALAGLPRHRRHLCRRYCSGDALHDWSTDRFPLTPLRCARIQQLPPPRHDRARGPLLVRSGGRGLWDLGGFRLADGQEHRPRRGWAAAARGDAKSLSRSRSLARLGRRPPPSRCTNMEIREARKRKSPARRTNTWPPRGMPSSALRTISTAKPVQSTGSGSPS